MKRLALALIVGFLHAGSLLAVCKTEGCRQAVAWKDGYTAIILNDDIAYDDYFAVLEAVKANKGVVAIETDRVFLGWVPAGTAGNIRAIRGVRAVLYGAVARPDDLVQNLQARPALEFFNRLMRGEFEDEIEAGLANPGPPLNGCVVDRRAATHIQILGIGAPGDAADDTPAPAHRRRSKAVTPSFWFRTPYQNPDMRGRVTVQVFRMDSDGRTDPNTYTWTTTDFNYASDQVYSAFTFWVNEATNRGITLSFRIMIEDPLSHYSRRIVPTSTRYEPITHNSTDDYLWVNDALWYKGYDSSVVTAENVYSQNEAFNAARKSYYGPFDRSFSVYVVYNPSPAPSTFADGYRAYAMYDGPFTMTMWNSGGWGPSNLGLVITHETGHIFWACDEYYDAPSNTGCFTCLHCLYNVGPRNQVATPWITNANCDNPNATSCDLTRANCMMRNMYSVLCSHTPGQVGW
jgi:hypothetical protein